MRAAMRAVREQATHIVQGAEAEAAASLSDLEADIDRERTDVERAVRKEYDALVKEATRRRDAVVSVLDAAARERMDELVEYVVRSVLAGAPAGDGAA